MKIEIVRKEISDVFINLVGKQANLYTGIHKCFFSSSLSPYPALPQRCVCTSTTHAPVVDRGSGTMDRQTDRLTNAQTRLL